MAKVAFHLPGGRGVLQGENAEVLQAEQVRKRVEELPQDGPLYLSNVNPWIAQDVVIPTSNVATLTPIDPLYRKIRIKYARVALQNVDEEEGPSNLLVTLYRLQSIGDMNLVAVPKTQASFYCARQGRLTVELPEEVELLPGFRYFIGFLAQGDLLSFSGQLGTNGSPLPKLSQISPILPDTFTIKTKDETLPVVNIVYLTEFGKQVF
jgi:hypothetical protein